MKISTSEQSGALRLTGALEIYDAQAVRQVVLERLTAVPELVLDLRAVESCDAAGAQLLWAALKAAALAGKRVRFEGISAAVTDCWAGLGLPTESLNVSHG